MTLADVLAYLKGAPSKDLLEISSDLNAFLTNCAAELDMAAWILFAVGLVAVFAVGLFGYKLVKLLTALLAGYAGYFIGAEIYHAVIKVQFEKCPEWVVYITGGIIAALFLFLGFVKFSYVLFALSAFGGYSVVYYYLDGNLLLALGGALLAGILMITLVRSSVILVTSFGCALLSVSFLAGLLPKVEAFRLEIDNWTAIGLAVLMFFVFATFQFVTNRRRTEYIE